MRKVIVGVVIIVLGFLAIPVLLYTSPSFTNWFGQALTRVAPNSRATNDVKRLESLHARMAELKLLIVLSELREKMGGFFLLSAQGNYPSTNADVLKAMGLTELPPLTLVNHPKQNEMALYGDEIFSNDGKIDGSKLKDSGSWAVVVSSNPRHGGTFFIDCTHENSKGEPWFRS